ncbi:hypothetical protein TNCT_621441, partial [Trichonephila clavata]
LRVSSTLINRCMNYSTPGKVVKGVIAKRIPAFVNLKKDKTYSWPYCDLTHIKTFIPEGVRNILKIKL